MLLKNTSGTLFVTTTTSRQPPAAEFVLVAKCCFDLVKDGAVTPVDTTTLLTKHLPQHDVYADDDSEREGAILAASDFAHFKPHGEIWLRGECHAPAGKSVTELPVKLSVGRWSKALLVTGDRQKGGRFGGLAAGAPTRFRSLPLDFGHAFGGTGFPLNPVGRGHESSGLPNVTNPADTSDPPKPASFAPISPTWPQRAGRVGKKYDDDYLENRFPYFPVDFDWRFFQAAPADQWIEGYFRGDEKVVLENLVPDGGRFETQLPGWRLRAFVNDDRDRKREVAMVLDTIAFDTDAATVTLTWRGLTPARKALCTDIVAALIVREPLGDKPQPLDTHLAALAAFEENPLDLEGAMPPGMEHIVEEMQSGMTADANAQAALAATNDADPRERLKLLIGKHIPASFGGNVSDAIDKVPSNPEANKQIAEGLDAMEKPRERGTGAIPPYVPLSYGPPPRTYIREHVVGARAKVLQAQSQLKAALAQASGAQASSAQRAELEERLAQAEQSLAQFDDPRLEALDPTLREPTSATPGPGADLSGQDLSERDLRGLDLRGARLDGALLVRANLRGVTFEGASLRGTVFFGADLSGCNLRGVDFSRGHAAETLLDDADLTGAKVDEAYFQDASMKRCRLDEVVGGHVGLSGADLESASLRRAELPDANFRVAKLDQTDLSEAKLDRAFFMEARGANTKFAQAQLDGVSFFKSDLRGAVFEGCRGERVCFMQAQLDDASFGRSVLPYVFMDEAKATGASFRGADLRSGRLARTELDRARFDDANLFEADLSDAEVNDATFARANLYGALLLRTAGKDCNMAGANTTMTRFGGKL